MKNQVNKSSVTSKKNSSTSKNHFFSPENSFFNVVQKKEEPFFSTNPKNPFFNKGIHQNSVVQAKSNDDKASSQTNFANNKNSNGLPNNLKSSSEKISGFDMSDVKVQYNSSEPSKIGALAFAQGNNIHLSSGQEKHLAHETWHVVQQKQGRVKPTNIQTKGVSINNDSSLEREADIMSGRLTNSNNTSTSPEVSRTNSTTNHQVIQRKKIPTNFGEFETTKFNGFNDKGVDVILKFHPDSGNVDAKKIALTQSVKRTNSSATAISIDPNQSSKMVGSGKSGAGYGIDQLSDVNNPIYSQGANLGAGKSLKDTPVSSNAAPVVGTNTNYKLGHCYKINPADAAKSKASAELSDTPKGGKNKGESAMFETAALAIDGADKDKYYGSVKWGYKIEGTTAAPTLSTFDITEASKGIPTSTFLEPAKLWNKGKTRGSLNVTLEADVYDVGDLSKTEKLAKDTKLEYKSSHMINKIVYIKSEVLNAAGTGSGKIVYIKNLDVTDVGDGKDTVNLPIPKVHVTSGSISLISRPPLMPNTTTIPSGTRLKVLREWVPVLKENGRVEVISGPHEGKSGDVEAQDWANIQEEN